ncbi:MAG: hypothetical protein ACREJ1_04540 [Candidatus Methylomirabilales bacterium]
MRGRRIRELREEVASLTRQILFEREVNEHLRNCLGRSGDLVRRMANGQVSPELMQRAMRMMLPCDAIDLGSEVVLPKSLDWDRWARGLEDESGGASGSW